jgi:shikimate O-hydroxycinnamoyltransferase
MQRRGPAGTDVMAKNLRLRTIERIRLKPAPDAPARVVLNALDHFESWFMLEVVYFYEQTLDPDRLQHSLEQTLAAFPLLCGRLRMIFSGSLAIDYPHAGPLFRVCESGLPLSEVRCGLHETFTVYDFIEKINPLLLPLTNSPLATFRITRFKGGGSALGISFSHALADGLSFYSFINHWSRVHEGLPASPPLHDRSLLAFGADAAAQQPRNLGETTPTCRGFRRLTAWQLCALFSRFLLRQRSAVCSVLPFTRSQVLAIKNAAQKLGPVSLNDALCVHLWQFCALIHPSADNKALRKLLIPANMRPKIDHPGAEHYFGNAIAHVELEAQQADLAGTNISTLASACRQRIAALGNEHLREQMLWLGEIEKRKQLFRVYADIDPYAGDCMISNLSRLPLYDAQFDGARPFRAEVPVIPIPWVLQVFPDPDENGGILVYAHMPRSAAAKLKLATWQAQLYKYGDAAPCT